METKCIHNSPNCISDKKIIKNAFKIYIHIHRWLRFTSNPIVHGVELKNKIGEASTIIMHEIRMRGAQVHSSAMYR